MMNKVIIAAFAFLFLYLQQTYAAKERGMSWEIKYLAQVPAETIELRNKRNKLLKVINIKQMVYLYSIMTAIEEAAEINATLLLIEGKDPNALATVIDKDDKIMGEGEKSITGNVIAVNFAMLDLFGMDVHEAAAIIGHEIAHLKLNHLEESKEARKRNPNQSVFSASGTKYSRDNEREADYLGVIWAIEAGYDPAGAARVHEKLYKISKTKVSGFGGSHPSSIERITVLKSLVRRLSR